VICRGLKSLFSSQMDIEEEQIDFSKDPPDGKLIFSMGIIWSIVKFRLRFYEQNEMNTDY
jgi:hypothetical protein